MLVDPHRTFSSLLVSAANRPALRAVRRAITDSPTRPNPLLMVGPPASGKTHLLHAAANQLVADHPTRSVLMSTAEAFCNDFVRDIRAGRMHSFRQRFAAPSMLFIDAMEDTETWPTTENELDNIVRRLVEGGRTVIMTVGETTDEHVARLTERIHSYPRGLVVRWHPAPMLVRIAAMQRILRARRQRMPMRVLVELARTAPTIPEASAALHRALLRRA